MNMIDNSMYEKLLLFLNDKVSGLNVAEHLNALRKTRYLSEGELKELQFKKLKKLLIHAEKHSLFYEELLSEIQFTANDFHSFEDLQRVPVLSREKLISYSDKIISKSSDPVKLKKGSSSGSTGQPVIYFTDDDARSAGLAAGYLAWELAGWKLGMKGLHIWGNPDTVNQQWNRASSKLKSRLFRHHKFPAYMLTEEGQFQDLYIKCIKNGYRFIDGYTNAIYLFADYLKKQNLQLTGVKLVLTTGENLQDYQRELIEEMIAPVFDLYGCSEINGIANECTDCGNYHTIDPHVYVEYGEPVNEEGECPLIITDLDNYAFPLIRYQNGDMAVPGKEASCKEPFGTINKISGRESDLIHLSDGGVLSVPSFFGSSLLKKVSGIRQYQIIRDRTDHLTIKLVTDESFTNENEKLLKESVKDYLKNSIKWDIEYVDSIPVSKTGKFKLVKDLTNEPV